MRRYEIQLRIHAASDLGSHGRVLMSSSRGGVQPPKDLACRTEPSLPFRQASDADSGSMCLVTQVQTDQQRRDLLHDPGVFEFAAVHRTNTGKFPREFTGDCAGIVVVAADDHIAIK